MIKIDYTNAMIKDHEIDFMKESVYRAHEMIHQKSGAGNDFLGWVDYPIDYDQEEFRKIKKCAQTIREQSKVLIVIGIGGSYLGARAAIEALSHTFYNQMDDFKVYFAGNNMSSTYLTHLIQVIEHEDVSINVISKSGTTTEPAIAFRILKKYMEEKYKEHAKKRIYVTTDRKKGALKALADEMGYETFAIPDDIGGRYSIFTPVGLLPMACMNIDIDHMMSGAKNAHDLYSKKELEDNPCYEYAVIRNILYKRGKNIEVFVGYEPNVMYMGEWFKQLFGESEGKDGKGIFPASVNFSTDLHSLGQFIQDGSKRLFETVLWIDTPKENIVIEEDEKNLDGLNYLSGKTMHDVNQKAFEGTLLAHAQGNVPNIIIKVPKLDAYYFGQLIYFFEKACGISGYLLGVNPFDQPGVESYKKNMFALLEKPGYEEITKELKSKSKPV